MKLINMFQSTLANNRHPGTTLKTKYQDITINTAFHNIRESMNTEELDINIEFLKEYIKLLENEVKNKDRNI